MVDEIKGTQVVYYVSQAGSIPAMDFIASLDKSSRRKFFYTIGLLEKFGHLLGEPYAKYLGCSLFELRFTAKEGNIRALYFFAQRNKAVLTNGFVKKTAKTPQREFAIALERRRDYLARHT